MTTIDKKRSTTKQEEEQLETWFEKAEEERLKKLGVKELGDLLAAKGSPGLSKTGKKADLVARLIKGVPVYVAPGHNEVTYEWDPTSSANKKKYLLEKSMSGKGNCIRCCQVIDQGCSRVGFVTGDSEDQARFPITRYYHLECFAKFPPVGINNFSEDVVFDKKSAHDEALKNLLSSTFNSHVGTDHKLPKVTAAHMADMRDETKVTRAVLGVSRVAARDISLEMRGLKRKSMAAGESDDDGVIMLATPDFSSEDDNDDNNTTIATTANYSMTTSAAGGGYENGIGGGGGMAFEVEDTASFGAKGGSKSKGKSPSKSSSTMAQAKEEKETKPLTWTDAFAAWLNNRDEGVGEEEALALGNGNRFEVGKLAKARKA